MSNLQEHQRERCQWNVEPDISCGDKCIHPMLEKKDFKRSIWNTQCHVKILSQENVS